MDEKTDAYILAVKKKDLPLTRIRKCMATNCRYSRSGDGMADCKLKLIEIDTMGTCGGYDPIERIKH